MKKQSLFSYTKRYLSFTDKQQMVKNYKITAKFKFISKPLSHNQTPSTNQQQVHHPLISDNLNPILNHMQIPITINYPTCPHPQNLIQIGHTLFKPDNLSDQIHPTVNPSLIRTFSQSNLYIELNQIWIKSQTQSTNPTVQAYTSCFILNLFTHHQHSFLQLSSACQKDLHLAGANLANIQSLAFLNIENLQTLNLNNNPFASPKVLNKTNWPLLKTLTLTFCTLNALSFDINRANISTNFDLQPSIIIQELPLLKASNLWQSFKLKTQ